MKKSGALFGPREEDVKKMKESSLKEKSAELFHYTDKRLPLVPDRKEKPVLGIRTNKNFITANAVQAILQGNIFLTVIDLEQHSARLSFSSSSC